MERSINKFLDIQTAYSSVDTEWWKYNDDHFCIWSKKNISLDLKKWQQFIKKEFTIIHKDYEYFDQSSPFETKYQTAQLKKNKRIYITWNPESLIIDTEINLNVRIYFGLETEKEVEKIVSKIVKLMISDNQKSEVYMVTMEDNSLTLRPFEIKSPEIDIELNYGKDFKEKHNYLLKALDKEDKKGIALLHGLPGTGKSMYIRHLISLLSSNRTMIYLPNQLINSLTDPSFLPLMTRNPNSILIIEDAEEAIKSRGQGGHTVDKLLNLSDGIISDFLGTQIICTFNSKLNLIDEALLRKGRLILKHEFNKLDIEQSQKLADKLGKKIKVDSPMTVSEIYNVEEIYSERVKETKKIGF